jgi:hypothetical protein
MSDNTLISGTSESDPEPASLDDATDAAGAGEDTTVEVTAEASTGEDTATVSVEAPVSMFRPTMRDPTASTSETGLTVQPKPLLSGCDAADDGPDPEADQALILGPSEGQEGSDALADPVPGPTDDLSEAPPLTPSDDVGLIEGTNIFGDRAAMWSGNPSEVGAGYSLDPLPQEECLCGETDLAIAGESLSLPA